MPTSMATLVCFYSSHNAETGLVKIFKLLIIADMLLNILVLDLSLFIFYLLPHLWEILH